MAIDTTQSVEAGFLLRWLSVGKLKEIITELQDNDCLYPNRVGNLAVIRGDAQIGFIK
jgi:hypothetical protein